MAWMRTSLSIMAISGAAARLGVLDRQLWAAGLGAVGGLAGLVSILLWWRRARHAHESTGMSTSRSVAAPGAVLAAALAVASTGLAALVLGVHWLVR